MTQTDFSEFGDVGELEYDGESVEAEDEDDEPSIDDVQRTIEGRRVEEEAWRQKEKERLEKHVPGLGE
ncbi:hypothetical protein [Natrarchaeobaculum aegyptiacum]|uniref:Uncharacterized protein n=1 Tax=Natrarchaeobaculum aegyptiacum TaxID=745377 RepID=A0A2Z2HU90_9EURY|nr:hypothetical protein [Natrarchaeobaculum aegyptiacum]ARS90799.1 hypothetical protein B1756_14425 [Natrarchaeobaculum aegyptiacum]